MTTRISLLSAAFFAFACSDAPSGDRAEGEQRVWAGDWTHESDVLAPPPFCPETDCDLSLALIDIHKDKTLTVRVDNLAAVSASAWLWAHDPTDPTVSEFFYIDLVKPGGSVWVDVDGFAVTDLLLEEGESCKGPCLEDNGATVTETGAVLWW